MITLDKQNARKTMLTGVNKKYVIQIIGMCIKSKKLPDAKQECNVILISNSGMQ
jgi:hypothetical protein